MSETYSTTERGRSARKSAERKPSRNMENEKLRAEMEVERGMTVYELDGTVDGQAYEIEVTAEGRLLEVGTDD